MNHKPRDKAFLAIKIQVKNGDLKQTKAASIHIFRAKS